MGFFFLLFNVRFAKCDDISSIERNFQVELHDDNNNTYSYTYSWLTADVF